MTLRQHIMAGLAGLTAACIAVISLSAAAAAAPIGNAAFGVVGAFSVTASTHLGNTDALFIGNGGSIIVSAPDRQDLSGTMAFGAAGTLRDIPSLSAFTPIAGFLTVGGGVSVDLQSLTIVARTGAPGFLNFFGDATLNADGFDPTAALLTGTATTTDNRNFTLALTVSAFTPAAPPAAGEETPMDTPPAVENPPPAPVPPLAQSVPEPAPFVLLLLGLILLGLARSPATAPV